MEMWLVNKFLLGLVLGYFVCAIGKWLILKLYVDRKVNQKLNIFLTRRINNCKTIQELYVIEIFLEKKGWLNEKC